MTMMYGLILFITLISAAVWLAGGPYQPDNGATPEDAAATIERRNLREQADELTRYLPCERRPKKCVTDSVEVLYWAYLPDAMIDMGGANEALRKLWQESHQCFTGYPGDHPPPYITWGDICLYLEAQYPNRKWERGPGYVLPEAPHMTERWAPEKPGGAPHYEGDTRDIR